jgi:hypothetical protein
LKLDRNICPQWNTKRNTTHGQRGDKDRQIDVIPIHNRKCIVPFGRKFGQQGRFCRTQSCGPTCYKHFIESLLRSVVHADLTIEMYVVIDCTANSDRHAIRCDRTALLCEPNKRPAPNKVTRDGQVNTIVRIPAELPCIGSVEAHEWAFVFTIGRPHHPSIIAIFIGAFPTMIQTKIMAYFMHYRRGVLTPKVVISRLPVVDTRKGNPAWVICAGRETKHDMVGYILRMSPQRCRCRSQCSGYDCLCLHSSHIVGWKADRVHSICSDLGVASNRLH